MHQPTVPVSHFANENRYSSHAGHNLGSLNEQLNTMLTRNGAGGIVELPMLLTKKRVKLAKHQT